MDITVKRNPATGRDQPSEKDFTRARVLRVVPTSDLIRKYIKHGVTRVGFLAEGSAEWPNDQFTRRRIKEGDVTVEEALQRGEATGEASTSPERTEPGPKRISQRKDPPAPPAGEPSVSPERTTAPQR